MYRRHRSLLWQKQPQNASGAKSDLSDDMIKILVNCARICISCKKGRNITRLFRRILKILLWCVACTMPLDAPRKGDYLGHVELTSETFVRVLLNLDHTSSISSWDKLARELLKLPGITSRLYEMQTLLNAHGLQMNVSYHHFLVRSLK